MKLSIATLIATLTEDKLNNVIQESGYNDCKVNTILEVDVRELDVRFYVRFDDPTGSFGDEVPLGHVFVNHQGTQLRAEF